jgi:hypothetical protein
MGETSSAPMPGDQQLPIASSEPVPEPSTPRPTDPDKPDDEPGTPGDGDDAGTDTQRPAADQTQQVGIAAY